MAYVLVLLIPLADIASAVLSTQEKAMPWNKFGRYVHPERTKAQELYRERNAWPSDPAFGLTREQLLQAFCQMKTVLKLRDGFCAYSLRHEYITRSLSHSTDALTVASGCGTSVAMLQKHYSHLMQVPSHMLAAMERATRKRR